MAEALVVDRPVVLFRLVCARLRELGAGDWDLAALPAQRVTILARWVQAASNQALAQSSPQRRYSALSGFRRAAPGGGD